MQQFYLVEKKQQSNLEKILCTKTESERLNISTFDSSHRWLISES